MGLLDGFVANIRNDVAKALTVDRAEIEAVVTQTRVHANEISASGVTNAKQRVTRASFGSYEGADVVVTAHSKAATITAQTIEQVKEALKTFAKDLEASLETTENADTTSKTYLERMGAITPGDAGESTQQQAENETGFELNDQKAPTTEEGSN
ncbi:hypothetical protein [Nocardia salmonicida]|uniref:hypothetical protein n=1 Tax=Nocardia salmonicida TaxID=53431 RepID=UPI0033FA82F2